MKNFMRFHRLVSIVKETMSTLDWMKYKAIRDNVNRAIILDQGDLKTQILTEMIHEADGLIAKYHLEKIKEAMDYEISLEKLEE